MSKDKPIKIVQIQIWYRTFKSTSKYMTGIRVTLSNGEQSPYFKGTQRQTGPVTLSIDQKETPHQITMETSPWACTGFTVQDKQGKDLCKWIGLKNDSGTI